MGPVMANCVRRSNALLGYNKELVYSDCMLRDPGWVQWVQNSAYECLVAAAVVAPFLFQRFLPAPGEGPTRATMDEGWLHVYTRGVIRNPSNGVEVTIITMHSIKNNYTPTSHISVLFNIDFTTIFI